MFIGWNEPAPASRWPPVTWFTRAPRAVVAGGGADVGLLEQSLARGCQTYITGNAARLPAHRFFRRKVDAFRTAAADHGVALVDGTHYGTEKPPQLAMVAWFQRLGLDADFHPDGPKFAD